MTRGLRQLTGNATAVLRPEQRAAVRAVLAGRDVFVQLATGAGKSVCYALPPLVRALQGRRAATAVVVLACQADRAAPALRGAALQAWLDGLLARHPCVEAAAACSATARDSAAAALALVVQARRAPLSLLLSCPAEDGSATDSTLRPAFVAALNHCFQARLALPKSGDDNNDGNNDEEALTDEQLTAGTVLEPTDDAHRNQLASLKRKVARRGGVEAIDAHGRITRTGFVALHRVLLEAGRADYAWQVLHAAGYDRTLTRVPAPASALALCGVSRTTALRALALAVRLVVTVVGSAAVGRALVRGIAAVRLRSSSSSRDQQQLRSTRDLLRLLLYDLFPF